MTGVFINLTENDLDIVSDTGKKFIVPGNPDLITPTRPTIQKSDSHIKGTVSGDIFPLRYQ